MNPVAIAIFAAGQAKRAHIPAAARIAYARRVAYRALRGSLPCFPALAAWSLAKTAAGA